MKDSRKTKKQLKQPKPLTAEEKLEKELEEAQAQIEDQKDKYLRLSAEFDNYRKRTVKEKAELILNGWWEKYQKHSAGNRRYERATDNYGNSQQT